MNAYSRNIKIPHCNPALDRPELSFMALGLIHVTELGTVPQTAF